MSWWDAGSWTIVGRADGVFCSESGAFGSGDPNIVSYVLPIVLRRNSIDAQDVV